jgi:hypothetical protein
VSLVGVHPHLFVFVVVEDLVLVEGAAAVLIDQKGLLYVVLHRHLFMSNVLLQLQLFLVVRL